MNQQHYKYLGAIDQHNNFKEHRATACDHYATKSVYT